MQRLHLLRDTKTRTGTSVEYRHAYSLYNNVRTRWYYSDESARNGDLRGLVVPDKNNPPSIDEQRVAGFYEQLWTTKPDAPGAPQTFIADVHYTNDDFFLREIPDDDIGLYNARYTTSTASYRVGLGDYASASLGGEYNQAIDANTTGTDDRLFQRLPEANIDGLKSFRPFGSNPYGLKLVTKGSVTGTQFERQEGYDGSRANINPIVQVPFHYKNYFQSSVQVSGIDTLYNTNNLPATSDINDSDSRKTFIGTYNLSTAMEKVSEVDPEGTFATLTSIGADNQDTKLARVKNVIEPNIRYTYVPNVAHQNELPQYDSLDRIRQKSVFYYGFTSTLIGKFDSVKNPSAPIEEITPETEDLPAFSFDGSESPLLPGASGFAVPTARRVSLKRGETRDLLELSVHQAYDYFQDTKNIDPTQNPFSDINNAITLYPTKTTFFGFDSTLSPDHGDLTSWGMRTGVKDDRGDSVRARYTFVNPNANIIDNPDNISQLEGNFELGVTDRVKLGYYARYDAENKEYLEQAVGVRLEDSCDCWHIDIGFSDRLNPDKQQFNIRFTFGGLGDITQDILYKGPTTANSGS